MRGVKEETAEEKDAATGDSRKIRADIRYFWFDSQNSFGWCPVNRSLRCPYSWCRIMITCHQLVSVSQTWQLKSGCQEGLGDVGWKVQVRTKKALGGVSQAPASVACTEGSRHLTARLAGKARQRRQLYQTDECVQCTCSYLLEFENIHLAAASPTLRASALPTSQPLKLMERPTRPVPRSHDTAGTYLVSLCAYLFIVCFGFTRV